jgi:hypothetical protein
VGSDCKKDSDCERKCIDDVCTNAAECKDLTFKKPGVFAVVFDGDDDESEVFCMGEGQLENGGPDTGGWTLLATSQPRSNAGEWAWNNRGRVVDKSTFGSVSRNRKEFKSVAYGKLVVKDLMCGARFLSENVCTRRCESVLWTSCGRACWNHNDEVAQTNTPHTHTPIQP